MAILLRLSIIYSVNVNYFTEKISKEFIKIKKKHLTVAAQLQLSIQKKHIMK